MSTTSTRLKTYSNSLHSNTYSLYKQSSLLLLNKQLISLPSPHNSFSPHNHTTSNMSAPNQGRQSPEPEKQSNAQTGSTASNPNDQGGASKGEHSKDTSAEQLKNLSSNPKGPLDDAAEEKTSKK